MKKLSLMVISAFNVVTAVMTLLGVPSLGWAQSIISGDPLPAINLNYCESVAFTNPRCETLPLVFQGKPGTIEVARNELDFCTRISFRNRACEDFTIGFSAKLGSMELSEKLLTFCQRISFRNQACESIPIGSFGKFGSPEYFSEMKKFCQSIDFRNRSCDYMPLAYLVGEADAKGEKAHKGPQRASAKSVTDSYLKAVSRDIASSRSSSADSQGSWGLK